MTDPTPAPLPLLAHQDRPWYAAVEALLPDGDTVDTWIDATWEGQRLARWTPAEAVAYQTGPKGRWNAARKALKQALADGVTGPDLQARHDADREAWYTAVQAHLPDGTTLDAWGEPTTWETLRWPRDMDPAAAVRHQTSPTRRGFRVEVAGHRPSTAVSLRGAKAALGRKLTTQGQTGRILHHGKTVVEAVGTTTGWTQLDQED